jgi:protein-tyrosine phosphatase
MIDLHCHLLPGIDDGPKTLDVSIEMARIASKDGISQVFCTPHIYPGLYENNAADIQIRVAALQEEIRQRGISLALNFGADTHLVPGLLSQIKAKFVPTLGGSRYLLLEPSHHVRPLRFKESVFELIAAGIVPIITHPERLTWVEDHYDDFLDLTRSGAWLQLTGGALLGSFGRRAQNVSERLLGEGWVAVIASDAHTTARRAPRLAEAVDRAAQLVGEAEASRMVLARPQAVVQNQPVALEATALALSTERTSASRSWWRSLIRR